MTPGRSSKQELILSTIMRHPGIHKSELHRILGLGWGTVAYHVQSLRQGGRIAVFNQGREARLFPTGISSEQMTWLSTARNPIHSAILDQLAATPGLGASEVASILGRSTNTVRRHLKAMHKMGIVAAKGDYGKRFYAKEEMPTGINRFLEILANQPLAAPPKAPEEETSSAPRPYNGPASREAIVAIVRADPGIHASDLARTTKLSWGNLAHHLKVLEETGLIRRWSRGARTCYFTPEVEASQWPVFVARRQDAVSTILDALATSSHLGLADLSRATGMDHRRLSRQLRRMIDAGLVQRVGPLDNRFGRSPAVADPAEAVPQSMPPTPSPMLDAVRS